MRIYADFRIIPMKTRYYSSPTADSIYVAGGYTFSFRVIGPSGAGHYGVIETDDPSKQAALKQLVDKRMINELSKVEHDKLVESLAYWKRNPRTPNELQHPSDLSNVTRLAETTSLSEVIDPNTIDVEEVLKAEEVETPKKTRSSSRKRANQNKED
jgi:hypothetical protein